MGRCEEVDTQITVNGDIPKHILAYWMGILIGQGIDFRVNPESPLYKVLREHRREQYREFEADGKIPDGDYDLPLELCYFVTHKGGNEDDIKVTLRPASR